MSRRTVGRLIEEQLMDCRAPERARRIAAGPFVLSDELRQDDRRDLDDAVFELLGVSDPAEWVGKQPGCDTSVNIPEERPAEMSPSPTVRPEHGLFRSADRRQGARGDGGRMQREQRNVQLEPRKPRRGPGAQMGSMIVATPCPTPTQSVASPRRMPGLRRIS